MHGISADPPEDLARFVEKNGLDRITFLSDPDLSTSEAWRVPLGKKHPKSRSYPRKAFLQPAVFIYDRSATERFGWRIKPKLLNFFGAAGRMSPADILAALDDCRA